LRNKSPGKTSYPVARSPDQFKPANRPSFSKPGIQRAKNSSRLIATTLKSPYAETFFTTKVALDSDDQNGIARPLLVDFGAGKPAASLIVQITFDAATSE